MDLPPGVFELIADMLPMPRVWQWSIIRLKRRCKLAPHQAVCDINIIMDEILTDACLFPGPQQSLLVRIAQNSQVRTYTSVINLCVSQQWIPCLPVCLSIRVDIVCFHSRAFKTLISDNSSQRFLLIHDYFSIAPPFHHTTTHTHTHTQ